MGMNEILDCIYNRRSIRGFTDEKISEENLRLIGEAAHYAPSARNFQKWKFTVLQNPELLKKLYTTIEKEFDCGPNYCFYHANALVIASAEKDYLFAKEDCSCALENVFLAAKSLGIGSVWINQLRTICDVPSIRAILTELQIPEDHDVFGMAALGYPAVEPKPIEKKQVTTYIL